MSVNDQVSDTETSLSPGQMLAQARERANLTHEHVAGALHMTVSKVKAIESDEYTKLNVETYIRGYLRAYSALVKIDCAPVLAAYELQVASGGRAIPKAEYVVRSAGERKGFGFILLIVGLLALLLLISVWFMGNRIQSEPVLPPVAVASSSSSSATPVEAADEAEQSEPESSAVESSEASTSSAASNVLPIAAEHLPANLSAAAEVQTASQSQLDHLYFVFSDECWLEVSDAQGDVLATNLQQPGSRVALMGQAPFKVKLGKVRSATITLNERSFEVNPPEDVTEVYSFTVGH
jgi:cytoskeleton protein RodZ